MFLDSTVDSIYLKRELVTWKIDLKKLSKMQPRDTDTEKRRD